MIPTGQENTLAKERYQSEDDQMSAHVNRYVPSGTDTCKQTESG
jgi:hypothetical protein